MKILKLTTLLVLCIAFHACQVDSELQEQEEATIELEKSTSQRSERDRGASRNCKTITITSHWMTVDWDEYNLIKNRIIEHGFTLQGNPDCVNIYTGNNQSPQWTNEVIDSMEFIGIVDDTITFRIKDLRIVCFDCPSSGPVLPHVLCSYTGQTLKVTSGNPCILGAFQLTEASTDNVIVDFISMLTPQYCEVCYISGDELGG